MNVMMNATPFTPDVLPYGEDVLAPTISGRTMNFHYGKHYKAYIDKLNALVMRTEYAGMTLEEIVKATFKVSSKQEIFQNAAQAWNHAFFWKCLTPNGAPPAGELKNAMERDLGGLDGFKAAFAKHGIAQFGSGWVWLLADDGMLKIETTSDASTPMADGKKCLLAIDVWEHAYYLDYQNRRPDFLNAVIDNTLNWEFAAQNFGEFRVRVETGSTVKLGSK